ncbi:hypothetical protein [Gordonia sp. UCD-TK1]|uniref:hypothetical protein n=1 Tax=Gordonia sp. UCD-TK1 TaxID=1857893 RepID=UPI00080DB3BB|nr:hypothetical protein [Gordonia sp. UCD-TK1]OCH80288.1 hypothetical protein A9310_21920 [Gordonia sp. UCD-TK1]
MTDLLVFVPGDDVHEIPATDPVAAQLAAPDQLVQVLVNVAGLYICGALQPHLGPHLGGVE